MFWRKGGDGTERRTHGGFRLLSLGMLLVMVSGYSHAMAADLKSESSTDSKITLKNSQRWFPSGTGQYMSGWSDDYSHHISDAKWEGKDATLQITALTLSGLYRWGEYQTRIRERELSAIYGEDLTEFAEIDCRPNGTCVRFALSSLDCLMVRYFTAPPGSKTQSDKGKSLVNVTYCARDLRMPLDMDSLLSAISIRK